MFEETHSFGPRRVANRIELLWVCGLHWRFEFSFADRRGMAALRSSVRRVGNSSIALGAGGMTHETRAPLRQSRPRARALRREKPYANQTPAGRLRSARSRARRSGVCAAARRVRPPNAARCAK